MDAPVARGIAHYSLVDRRTRFDEPFAEHVERVAATLPAEVRSIAFLHDVLERSATTVADLRDRGLTELELSALELLTRAPGESYELHVLRIAAARGPAGRLARMVKLADLDDHLAHRWMPDDAPPYAWARRRIAVADERMTQSERAA